MTFFSWYLLPGNLPSCADATKPFMVTIEATVRNIYVNGKVKISAYFLVYHQANLPQRISRQSRKTLAVSTGPPVQVLLAYRPVIQRKVFTPSHVEVSYSRKIIHGITSREVSMTAESLDVGPDQAYDAGEFASPQYPRLTSSTASQAGSVLAEGPEEDGTIPPPAVGKPSLYNPDVARQAAKDFGDMILHPVALSFLSASVGLQMMSPAISSIQSSNGTALVSKRYPRPLGQLPTQHLLNRRLTARSSTATSTSSTPATDIA
ncbi:hypothetical protein H2201_005121 [Coniosporium apollinis]|uniref:Arrestin C-terminal-like domain-containing protein n=1 Tax=Coniosporium apollinis TaxID=61459 RepID=A0ABQ9NSW9_9PEZI|nr:hypothetical protein H2201_005121 [Coniosporium apollinis]